MSDKYEKAAREFLLTENEDETDWNFSYDLPRMMRAFRWYEEKYLADALTAAAMMMNNPLLTAPAELRFRRTNHPRQWGERHCGFARIAELHTLSRRRCSRQKEEEMTEIELVREYFPTPRSSDEDDFSPSGSPSPTYAPDEWEEWAEARLKLLEKRVRRLEKYNESD